MKKIFKYILIGIGVVLVSFLGSLWITGKNLNEIALEVFTVVKSVKGKGVPIELIDFSTSKEISHKKWTDLLQEKVSADGNVDYEGFIQDSLILNEYLSLLSSNPPSWNQDEDVQLAYWINAYNAFTVKLIVDHYPLQSIKEISDGLPMINSPWDMKFFQVGGIGFDLNTIEHEILRKRFEEPRIHFAINCASISCPKLRNEAYESEKLIYQLEDQASTFLNDSTKNVISKNEARLSMIFNWFESDFEKKGSINSFLMNLHSSISEETKISYLKYDWSLN